MKKRNLSKDTLHDPTHSCTMIRKYERQLSSVFQMWKKDVIKAIQEKQSERTHLDFPFDLDKFLEQLKALADVRLHPYSDKVIDSVWKEATQRGIMFGALQTKKYGLMVPDHITPDDWDAIKGFSTKGKTGVRGVSDDINKKIIYEISDAIKEGRNIDRDLIQSISDIVGKGTDSALRIARTEVMDGVNTGAVKRYVEAGVEKLEWLTVLDEKACIRDLEVPSGDIYAGCDELDGVVFDIGEAPKCPIHPQCRCTLIPFIEAEEEE